VDQNLSGKIGNNIPIIYYAPKMGFCQGHSNAIPNKSGLFLYFSLKFIFLLYPKEKHGIIIEVSRFLQDIINFDV